MGNQTVHTLEKMIRDDAIRQARLEFRQHRSFVTRLAHSGINWATGQKEGMWKSLDLLEEAHCKEAADKAVITFISTYSKIVQEFPALIEGAVDDAIFDERQNNG